MSDNIIYIDLSETDTCLDEIYSNTQIYIKEIWFNPEKMSIKVKCLVPGNVYYTAKPIPYVTAENYVRCLSQGCYLLAELAIKNNLLDIEIDIEEFIKSAANYELYYRNLSMTFHKKIERDIDFELKLILSNIREIKKLDKDLILFTFQNERMVISGEMSFIYINE